MFENYTRQSLPSKEYREYLGTAICVFNSNNAFVIENILRINSCNYNWYELIDSTSGQLKDTVKDTISLQTGGIEIANLFSDLVDMRNRIIHSFQVTNSEGKQLLATKEKEIKGGKQYIIDKKYLMNFINLNEKLSDMLHSLRGY